MTSALPLSSFSSFPPSFFSSHSYPQPSTSNANAATTTLSYAFPPGSFNFNTNPFFYTSPPSSSAGLVSGGGWNSPFGTSSHMASSLLLTHDSNGNDGYLYENDVNSLSDAQSLSDAGEGGGGGGSPMNEEQGGGGGRGRTSSTSSTVNTVEPSASSQKKSPATSNKRKKPTNNKNNKKKVSASGSDDEEEDQEGGGGKRRGSGGGGGSELGSGDGEGRGTTLAEVLAEQGLTQAIYNGLPSAKKRQLRNKVSARAFRARRKDYIDTLEGQLSEKDAKVEAQRAEIARLKNENQLLRTRLRHSNNDH
ncbi:hypothetical protein BDY24DRAFT_116538 [Mrakia frigida]|uniref:bZIP transcription factor n=1 Tax=Mrakia frigida TaxID=29902 RepID=UPI003FCC07AB